MSNISLKLKLMMMLVLLTTIMLVVYGWLAIVDFRRDKIAYVFDANLSHSRSTAIQIRSELDFAVDKINFYLRGFNSQKVTFHPYAQSMFTSDSLLQGLWVFQPNSQSQQYVEATKILQDGLPVTTEQLSEPFNFLTQEALANKISLRILPEVPGHWLLGLRVALAGQAEPVVVISYVNKGGFIESFAQGQMQDSFIVRDTAERVVSPIHWTYDLPESAVDGAINAILDKLAGPEVISTYQAKGSKEKYLVAASEIGYGGLKVVSMIPESTALEAVYVIVIKSVLFIMLLICITVFISVLSSTGLTAALKRLLAATQQVAQGNFDVEIPGQGRDEVGSLSAGFRLMAAEIKRLLSETAEKARMESELKTAQVVQSTLFPTGDLVHSDLEIRGFYQSASECGGDWWFYSEVGSKVYFWIGDATGHGVPAALVTSAAKSAAGILEKFPDLPLDRVMELFNSAIYGTSHGTVMMTFFLGCFDRDSMQFEYCNASHDPPFLMRPQEGKKLKKKDLTPLMEKIGKRLGETPDSQYEKVSIDLSPGDRIIFYTDGVTELNNSEGDMWGERQFARLILQSFNDGESLQDSMKTLGENIKSFRNGHPLHDDVTYFMFECAKNKQQAA